MEYLELIGTAAFAISGAMIAIDKGADIFGVMFLAIITALGGGIIRDVLLGNIPPVMFTSYTYVAVAVVCALVIFSIAYSNIDRYAKYYELLDKTVNIFDAVGLAVFTVSGVNLAASLHGMDNPLLLCLMGMTTGVGGGMLRDVLTNSMPMVLTSRIYAVASLSGAVCYYLLLVLGLGSGLSAVIACVIIFALRILATVFGWNLPRVKL